MKPSRKEFYFQWICKSTIVLSCILLLYSIWSNFFFPLQDYPEWLFQSKVLYKHLAGESDWAINYEIVLFPLPPNLIVTVVLALLQFLVSVDVAGKVLLTGCVFLFILGWRYLFRKHDSHHPLQWLGIAFAQNYFFFMGFLSYILGLALLMMAVGWLYSTRELQTWRSTVIVLLISLVLFITHIIAIAVFWIAVTIKMALEYRKSKTFHWKLIAAICPSLALAIIFFATSSCGQAMVFYNPSWIQFFNWRYVICLFHRFIPFQQSLPISFFNIVIWCLLFISVLISVKFKRTQKFNQPAVILAIIMAILAMVLPWKSLGGFSYINQRFVLPAVIFFFASIRWIYRRYTVGLVTVGLGLVITIIHVLQLTSFDREARRVYVDTQTYMVRTCQSLFLGYGFVDEFEKDPAHVFSGIIRPMLHFRRYYDLDNPDQLNYTFESGIVHIRPHSSDETIFDVEKVIANVSRSEQAIQPLRNWLHQTGPIWQNVVIIGTPSSIETLQTAFDEFYIEKRASDHLKILTRISDVEKDFFLYMIDTSISNTALKQIE